MKKLAFFLFVFFSCQFAWADLDGSFDYMNIPTQYFSSLKFKKTTLREFKVRYPDFKSTTLEDGQAMLVSRPKKNKYCEIRVGFNKGVVEWVEFILKEKTDLSSFVSRYGDADDINRDYNAVYDYYNYGSFNVSADKQGEYLYSITLFENPKLPEELIGFDSKLPDLDKLGQLKTFVPNEYLEETFSDDFDCLYPSFNDDGTKTYTLKENVVSKYSKVEFIFKDGLLKFLVLHPLNITFDKITKVYGKNFKIDKTTKNKIIYDYPDFYVITDLQNRVLQIAVD
ncbi:MAG: hypothetical protein WCF95_02980 [bacterium]